MYKTAPNRSGFGTFCFKTEQADGPPFTHSGADQIRSLGIKTIVMPLVAVIISAVVYSCFGLTNAPDWSNAVSVELGIVLILASLVFHYGAELETKTGESIK